MRSKTPSVGRLGLPALGDGQPQQLFRSPMFTDERSPGLESARLFCELLPKGTTLTGILGTGLGPSCALILLRGSQSSCKVEVIIFTYRQLLNRDDIGIVLINQYIAEMVRHALDAHQRSIPAVLEIPSKDHPYDAAKDSILRRAKGMFTAEDLR
ncbi:V-type proton ATPase subunit F isoform X1 [Heterocephalus glaber]|uniref:V-ATPase 14 kDa subunit n=1 Tax=Heterocephalus glaber TaxID=10181 RepID=A0AAX6R6R3_HETGA|nr:V-type proton ATPase subunit F isoform X1 [Heterocephalus glaber]